MVHRPRFLHVFPCQAIIGPKGLQLVLDRMVASTRWRYNFCNSWCTLGGIRLPAGWMFHHLLHEILALTVAQLICYMSYELVKLAMNCHMRSMFVEGFQWTICTEGRWPPLQALNTLTGKIFAVKQSIVDETLRKVEPCSFGSNYTTEPDV